MYMHHGIRPEVDAKGIDRDQLRRAWGFTKPYRGLLYGFLALSVIGALIGVIPPLVFKYLLDTAVRSKSTSKVNLAVAASIVLAVTTTGLTYATRWQGSRIGEGLIRDIRVALYDHVQRMPIAFFTRTQTGSLMSRLNNDVVGAQQAFTYLLRTTVTDVLTVLFTLVAMVRMSWQITLLSLTVVPVMIFVSRKVGTLQERAARQQMKYNAELNTVMTERFNVAGALLVKLFGRPKQESREFNDAASRVADIGVKRAMTGMGFSLLLPFVGAIGTAMAYWWGGHRLIDGTITTGTIVALASYLTRLYGPLGELAGARVDFVTAFVSFDRVFEVLDAKPLITEREGARSLDKASLAGEIRFDGVRFRYPAPDEVSVKSLESGTSAHSGEPSALVLDGVSFAVAPGTLTALVGPSGAGKTTLAQLIPRLYDVTEGSVLLDGIDVRDLTFASLVDAIGVVSQDAHLFHDTIAANLRYARPDATQEQIIAAAQAAQIHDMIASLPDGYDTMVGERGYRLSGGEKQRLAIARVLLKDPRIVILDEATAHLDSETEVQIQDALERALTGRTSVVIAHRLSTIQAADQILVIDAGRVVERGRHEDLITTGGLYSELYETQFLRTAAVGR